MRKSFLILMLMALLPLAGWATTADLEVKPALATGLTYTGNPLPLLTGSVEFPANYNTSVGGVLFVAKNSEEAPTTAEIEAATSEFPTGTDAGKYYIYYKVLKDNDAYDSDKDWALLNPTVKFTRISPATPNITAPTAASLTYTGENQELLTGPGSTTFGILKYSLTGGDDYIEYSDENFATTIKGLNATEYTVHLKVAATDNWVEATSTKKVTIEPKDLGDEDVQIEYTGAHKEYVNGTPSTIDIDDITVTWNGTPLTKTTDFAIGGYTNNTAVGKAICNLTSGSTPNFTGGSVEFDIDPKPITAAMFNIANVIYTGATITQANLVGAAGFTAKDGATDLNAFDGETGDYTLTTTAKAVTTGATVTIAGTGNYTGELTANFDVEKATLNVHATDLTVARGTDVTADVMAGHYTLEGWVGEDAAAETKPIVSGNPTLAFTGSTNAAGTLDNAITVTDVTGMSAANYTFTAGNAADVIVNASPLTIAFKDDIAFYYKDKVPAFSTMGDDAIKAGYLTISTPEAVSAIGIKVYDAEDALVAEGTELEVGSTYTLKVTAKTVNVNYLNPDVEDKSITVGKAILKVVAQAQGVAYPGGVAIVDNLSDTYVKITNAADGEYNYTTFNTAFETAFANENEFKSFFIESLTWDADAATLAEPGEICVTLTSTYGVDNFDVTPTNGAVTFTGVADDITLTRVSKTNFADATVAATITEYNGTKKNVTIKYADEEAFNTFKAGQWYAMVLPFETDAKQISDAFGYAIVDLLRTSNTDPNRTYFDLHMNTTKIPANTPFLIKAWDAIDMAAVGVTFATVDIEAPSAENGNLIAVDEAGNQFIGTYTGINGGFGGNGSKDYWYSLNDGSLKQPSATAYLRQLSAYIQLAPEADAARHMFIIEDVDGSTTAIKATDIMTMGNDGQGIYNLNGVKMNGVPAQKGVYIQNGKKVVIK